MAKRNYFVMDSMNVLPLRMAVGAVFIMHGGRTIFINGFPWLAGILEGLGVPYPLYLAVFVALVEFLGGLALAVGFFTRLAALLLAGNMAVAFFLVHMKKGFFVQQGGFEFVMILFAACLVFLIGDSQKRILRA